MKRIKIFTNLLARFALMVLVFLPKSGIAVDMNYGSSGATITNDLGQTIMGNISATTGILQITNSGTIVGNINLGTNNNSSLTLSGGLVTGNVTLGGATTLININSDNSLNGNIIASTNSQGIVAVGNDLTFNGNIGSSGAEIGGFLTIGNSVLTLGSGNVYVTEALLGSSSVLNLGSGIFTASDELKVSETSTLNLGNNNDSNAINWIHITNTPSVNLGSGVHAIEGIFSDQSADTITNFGVTIADAQTAGKLKTDGVITIVGHANLNVNFATSTYIGASGASQTILSGAAGSSFSVIAANNISVNGVASNRSGLITFTTTKVGDDLVLTETRDSSSYAPTDGSTQGVFSAIANLNNPTGGLMTVVNYLTNTNNVSNSDRDKTIETLSTNNTGVNQATYGSVSNVIATIEGRVDASVHNSFATDRLSSKMKEGNYLLAAKKTNSATDASYDNNSAQKNNGVWAQVLGSSAKQQNKDGFNGYNSKTKGLSFGADTKIDKDTVVGIGLGISNTNIYASTNLKKTNLASYQLNFYGSKNFDGYFIDAFVAAAYNQYDSNRTVALTSQTAHSQYNGQTYSAKIKASTIKELGGKFELLPETGLLLAHNELANYTETGADTLNLNIKNNSSNLLEGTIGAALRYNAIEIASNKIFPKIKATYGYDFIGNKQTATSNFVGQNVSFDTQSSKINRQVLRLEAGLDIYNINSVVVSANYILEKKHTYSSKFGLLRVRWEF